MGDPVKDDIWRAEDMVNHPAHYTQGKVECIDAIEASMTPEEYAGFLKGQVVKYVWRFEKKWNPLEDLDKARYYLVRLIEFMGEHPTIFQKEFTLNVHPTEEITLPPHTAKTVYDTLKSIDGAPYS